MLCIIHSGNVPAARYMPDTIRNSFSGSGRMLYLKGYFPDQRTLSQAPQWEDAELRVPQQP